MNNDNAPMLPMPIKVKPYTHQVAAYNFICELFGLVSTGGDSVDDAYGELHSVRKNIPTVGKPNT